MIGKWNHNITRKKVKLLWDVSINNKRITDSVYYTVNSGPWDLIHVGTNELNVLIFQIQCKLKSNCTRCFFFISVWVASLVYSFILANRLKILTFFPYLYEVYVKILWLYICSTTLFLQHCLWSCNNNLLLLHYDFKLTTLQLYDLNL